eukprot:8528026-Pyramimonas_sp.AAC.1
MSKVVLFEQQRRIFDADRVTTMRVYVTAAAKRGAAVKEDDVLAEADAQANFEKVSKSRCAELETCFVNKCFKMQDVSTASTS